MICALNRRRSVDPCMPITRRDVTSSSSSTIVTSSRLWVRWRLEARLSSMLGRCERRLPMSRSQSSYSSCKRRSWNLDSATAPRCRFFSSDLPFCPPANLSASSTRYHISPGTDPAPWRSTHFKEYMMTLHGLLSNYLLYYTRHEISAKYFTEYNHPIILRWNHS